MIKARKIKVGNKSVIIAVDVECEKYITAFYKCVPFGVLSFHERHLINCYVHNESIISGFSGTMDEAIELCIKHIDKMLLEERNKLN